MAETVYDEIWANGVLVSRTPRTISDAEIDRRDAPKRLRQSYIVLRQWANDADTTTAEWDTLTQTQKNTRLKIVIGRFGELCDSLGDLLLAQAFD